MKRVLWIGAIGLAALATGVWAMPGMGHRMGAGPEAAGCAMAGGGMHGGKPATAQMQGMHQGMGMGMRHGMNGSMHGGMHSQGGMGSQAATGEVNAAAGCPMHDGAGHAGCPAHEPAAKAPAKP